MLRRAIFLSLLAFVGAGISSAAGRGSGPPFPSVKGNWNRIESAHFIIFSDAREDQAAKIARDLERFRSVLATFHTRLVIDPPRPTFLYLFKNDKDFQPYAPRVDGRPLPVAGYFTQHKDANYMAAEITRGQDVSRVIYHEFLHQFLTANLPNVPLWFDEGIAEYYSTFQVTENTVKVGLPHSGHVQYLLSHPMIPLEDLFQVNHDSPEYNEAARMGTLYAESWVVVHYLLNGDSGLRPQVGVFLDRLREGVPLEESFTASFGMGYERLLGRVQKYVGMGRFPFSTVTLPPNVNADTSTSVKEMKRDEVLAELGDLLARIDPGRGADAAAYFQEALRQNPKCASAEAGLGYLAASEGRFPEAIAHYDAAMAVDPGDFQFPFLAALSWLGEPPRPRATQPPAPAPTLADLTKARELLGKTIQIRPGFGEAYVSLGETYLDEDEMAGEGIALLQKAQKLLPSRMDVVADLVVLQLKVGNRSAAGNLVEKTILPTGDSRALRYARSVLEAYDKAHAPAEPNAGEAQAAEPASDKE